MASGHEFETSRLKVKGAIMDYFTEQIAINLDALKGCERESDSQSDSEEQRLREKQILLLRDRVNELSRHLAVIKRIV